MKPLITMVAACAFAASFSLSQTADAANASNSNNTATNSPEGQQIVNGAIKTVSDIKADPHFLDLMKQAKGVFIVPNLVKGAFIAGAQGGQGVLLAHEHDHWSDPAFLTVGSVSFGLQAGGEAGPVIMLLMTDKALNDFTQENNFSLNANAGLTVISYSARGQAPVGKGDIVVWSNANGAFAGASLSASDITSNSQEDHNFYGKTVTTAQIIKGNMQSNDANKLRDALPA